MELAIGSHILYLHSFYKARLRGLRPCSKPCVYNKKGKQTEDEPQIHSQQRKVFCSPGGVLLNRESVFKDIESESNNMLQEFN